MLTSIRSSVDEIQVINILKRCSDKKAERERVIKSPAFLFVAIYPGLKYMCKAKYKTLGNR